MTLDRLKRMAGFESQDFDPAVRKHLVSRFAMVFRGCCSGCAVVCAALKIRLELLQTLSHPV